MAIFIPAVNYFINFKDWNAMARTFCLILTALAYLTHFSCAPLDLRNQKNCATHLYFFCIDGGGSKTELQILDRKGAVVKLLKDGHPCDVVKVGASNLTTMGKSGFESCIDDLFKSLSIESSNKKVCEIANQSTIIGGFAGAGRPDSKEIMINTFKKFGFCEDNIFTMADSELALEIAPNPGIIIIAGTGSICLGKNGNKVFRVGGLGHHIGDEGSGYKAGLEALKATMEESYGWGEQTTLTPKLRSHFKLDDTRSLIAPFYQHHITPTQVAALTPLIFDQAAEGDACAIKIVDRTIQDLAWLLKTTVRCGDFKKCPIFLIGGVFRSIKKHNLLSKVLIKAELRDWEVIDFSAECIATKVVQQALL
jgi:N-acetylglucosamine kinase-like BadF-type ATPase